MLKWSLCNFSDAYVHVGGTILVPNTGTATVPNNRNKKVIFKICALFTDWICEINTQADNARDESALDNSTSITDFPANNNNIILLKFEEIITGHNGTIKRSK